MVIKLDKKKGRYCLMMSNSQSDKLRHICAWCTQEIIEGKDVFGFGAKASHGVDLKGKEGEFVSLKLALRNKEVFALVPSESSAPKADGFDLIFITCSEDCAQSLKDALELERDVFENNS
jgi:hypothetical protein